jgi:predicted amidohydrolase YtcJ
VLTGGTVWTGIEGAPLAQAVAVRGGRIVAVGSGADVQRYIGQGTRRLDLGKRLVLPGFIDDHTHFLSGGFQLGSVDLRSASSPAEFTRRIDVFARSLPEGRWITGGDWDHELFPRAQLPRREWIDSASHGHPVFVNRLDGHMALASTRTLRLAGITRATKDPPGGTIVRDPRTHEPTGVLKDAAMDLVYAVLPDPSDAEFDDALRRGQAHALSYGVTMIEDVGGHGWRDLEAFRRAENSGELKLRVYSFVPLADWHRLRDFMNKMGSGSARLRWGGLKGFVDGSLGSTTAWFFDPYNDAPGTSGLVVSDTAKLREWILEADRARLQVAMHAIGDRANNWILDTYDWVERQDGARDRRFRVEHAQHLLPSDIKRFSQLGVLASMQPYHAIDDGRWAQKRIGPVRIRTTYAFRSLLAQHARLMFGSDWTVAPIDPLLGIYAAVTRRTIDGRNPNGWVPDQKIGVEDALRAYTVNNAYGAFADRDLGTLARGKRADMVVLSRNILKLDPVHIPDARVDYTIIGGEIVYVRQRQASF